MASGVTEVISDVISPAAVSEPPLSIPDVIPELPVLLPKDATTGDSAGLVIGIGLPACPLSESLGVQVGSS